MWRDRTNLFVSYRQSYSHHPAKKSRYVGPTSGTFAENGSAEEESRGLMSAGAFEDTGDALIEMDLLPPRWLDIQDEVTERIGDITKRMKSLELLHQKHVLPGFDDEAVKQREERQIEAMTQEVTKGFQDCQKSIRRIDVMLKQQGGVSKGEETMAKNLKVSLATRVGDVSTTFRKKQSAYLKKMRALGGMSSPLDRSSTPIQNPYTDPSLMDSESDRTVAQSTLLQTKQKQRSVGMHDQTIAQREREIEDIAQGIIDLSNIFQELQSMVIDQGTMLDRIDYNVDRMATDVKEADKELKVATTYQKKGTKRKIIFLLILLVIGMFILVLIKPRKRDSAASPAPVEPPPVPDVDMRRALAGYEMEPLASMPWTRKDWRRRR